MKNALFAFLTVTVILSSCKKSDSTNNSNNNLQDNLLKKFVLIDQATADTMYTFTFSYDAQNRCTNIIQDYRDVAEKYSQEYSYTGNDTLVDHITTVGVGSTYSDLESFHYDANSVVVDDEINDGSVNLEYSYVPMAGNRTEADIISEGTFTFLKSVHLQQYNAQGNLSSELDSSFSFTTGSPVFEAEVMNNLTYDSHPNPFYRIYPKKYIIMQYEFPFDDHPLNHFINAKNNILTQQRAIVSGGYSPFNNRYTYTYNVNGFPGSVIYEDLEAGAVYKGIYYY